MGSATQILIIALLLICMSTLLEISENTSKPLTEDQVKAQLLVEKHEAEKERIRLEKIQKLEAKNWKEVESPEEALMKFIAHGYHVWLLVISFFIAAPKLLMNASRPY